MPKILAMFLGNPFSPDPRVYREVTSLESADVQIVVFCWDRFGQHKRLERLRKSWVVRYQPKRVGSGSLGFVMGLMRFTVWSIAGLLSLWMRRRTPKIVYCHDFDTLLIGVLGRLLLGIPFVYDAHEIYSKLVDLPGMKPIAVLVDSTELLFSRLGSGVVVANEAIERHLHAAGSAILVRNYPPSWLRSQLADGGRRFDSFSESPTIGYLGALTPHRGLRELVASAKWIRACCANAKILVVGEGPLKGELEKIVRRDHTEDMVKFHNFVKYEELGSVTRHIHLMSILYSPDLAINWIATPNKLYEALVMGVPVIVRDFGFLRDFVQSNRCGVIVRRFGATNLARILCHVFKDDQLYKRLSANCLKISKGTMSWEQEAVRLVALVNTLLKR